MIYNGFYKRKFTCLANALLDFSMGFIMTSHPEWSPRAWSNRQLKQLGPLFDGSVLNVSAIRDGDKEGGFYEHYFPNAKSYTITNFGLEVGSSGKKNEIQLDISIPYDGSIGTFDVVVAHTVLEHVYPHTVSIPNLCLLSKDVVIIVSPFIQGMHGEDKFYYDYFRFTPLALEEILKENGFTTVYCNWNEDNPFLNVYLIHVATRNPDKYKNLPATRQIKLGVDSPGLLYSKMLWPSSKGMKAKLSRRLGEWVGQTLKRR